jgi:hypothetical protein
MKTCRDCKVTKDLSEFVSNKLFKDGKDTLCILCNRKRVKAYRAAGKRNSTKESQAYRLKYPGKRNEYKNQYYKEHYATPRILKTAQELKLTKDAGRERRHKLHTRPKWADLEKIKTYYAIRDWLNYTTFGRHYQVDHVVPIMGKDVCGLHVENNLAVVTAEYNMKKSNKLLSQVTGY